jgi:prophage regulatory protein
MSASINILRIDGTSHKTGLSKSSIWKGVKAGTFPAPLELGPKARGWRESDLDEWLQSRPVAQVKPSGAGV